MSCRWSLVAVAASALIATAVHAAPGCDAEFNNQYQHSRQFVESLRPQKPGQVRVFAADGTEFTAGQVQWLRGRMRLIGAACAKGEQSRAARLLNETRDLLQAHRRSS